MRQIKFSINVFLFTMMPSFVALSIFYYPLTPAFSQEGYVNPSLELECCQPSSDDPEGCCEVEGACDAPKSKELCEFEGGKFYPDDMVCDTETQCEKPTAIRLSSFNVTQQDGQNIIIWITGTEIETEGFHILRSTAKDGPYQQITKTLIPYIGTGIEGVTGQIFRFTYTDRNVQKEKSYYYRLETISKEEGKMVSR